MLESRLQIDEISVWTEQGHCWHVSCQPFLTRWPVLPSSSDDSTIRCPPPHHHWLSPNINQFKYFNLIVQLGYFVWIRFRRGPMTGRLQISRVPLLRCPTSPTWYCRGSRVVKFSRNRSTCCFATDRTNSISYAL